ncbi:sugar transferase [Salinisphaera hydrothermalis]|uniref:sugar transferase n=1 Tax=Salinisphaera hydrothermalis TaxID=563188 RepID=UPI00334106CB
MFLLIAIGVRCSGKQIFFAHERIGRAGRRFRCLKFRSMYPDAEARLQRLLAHDPCARAEWAENFKLKNDPRVTRFGAVLRRSSLDELPQLFNVLAGHMCLVGPRPIIKDELVRYGRYARFYLSTRPGMTGLWQVSGRSDTSYRRRVALDCAYVRSQSLGLDLKILFKTIVVVWKRQSGAY